MRTQQFTDNGVTFTVRAETIADALDTDMLTNLMGFSTARENYRRARFVQMVLLTTVEGDLGFAWPTPDDSVEALLTAYAAWQQLPADVIRTWTATLALANATPNKADLSPDLSEKKETILTS